MVKKGGEVVTRVSPPDAGGAEPFIARSHATLVSFDNGTWTATIQLSRSPDTTIANVPVSRSILAATMVVGQALAVLFFDANNSADAMVVGIH